MDTTISNTPSCVMLAGNPNVGKTTLFNALTGSNQRVGNYSGITVDFKVGEAFSTSGNRVRIYDLPGFYSFSASSPEEKIAIDALQGVIPELNNPDLILCVVDASNLERHLQLAIQLIQLGTPCVLVLNKVDIAEKAGVRLDVTKLSEELGIPVVAMSAHLNMGLIELKQALRHPHPKPSDAMGKISEKLADTKLTALAMRICQTAARRPDSYTQSASDKIDTYLLHPIYGWIVFLAVMFAIFWAIFSFASYPMGWIESAVAILAENVSSLLSEGDFRSLLVDGVIAGVGGMLVFLPQIVLLFLFIGLLESSGYMARAAFLMDGFMTKAGLSGKAFLPLFSSYACAIPGVMATRTIDSAKERLTTLFIAPWMSCSARLPVYFLIIPLLINQKEGTWLQALILLGIYAIGTLSAFSISKILRSKLGEDTVPNHFLLELPPYQLPQWPYIIRHVCERAWSFVKKAGTIILGLSVLLWALSTYPKSDSNDPGERLAHSAMGKMGAFIEPVVSPLGFDGRTGTAILTSFAAREVLVSSLAILFRVEEAENEEETRNLLRDRISTATWPNGKLLFTPLSLISLLVFFIYALQCLPTSAVVAKESGSWKWAIGQFVFMSGFAYFAALIVFQVGSFMGF